MKSSESICEVSRFLLQINAIKLNPEKPFTWASGLLAPIYCDNRRILSFPGIRQDIARRMATMVNKHYPESSVIAGVATGAIAIGVLTAERLGLPFVYTRPGAKKHGLGSKIEGHFTHGQTTVVIEDLISTAKSSLEAVRTLREAGLKVNGMAAIFTYELDQAAANLRNANCRLHTLSNYDKLLDTVAKERKFSPEEIKVLQQWRKDPVKWSKGRHKTK